VIDGTTGQGRRGLGVENGRICSADEVGGTGAQGLDGLDVGQSEAEGFHGVAQGVDRGAYEGDDGWHGVR